MYNAKRVMVRIFIVTIITTKILYGQISTSEVPNVEAELVRTARLTGTNYTAARLLLENAYPKNKDVLEKVRTQSSSWEARLLSAIVIERKTKAKEIADFLAWAPKFPYPVDRSATKALKMKGEIIAEKAKEHPMFIVEHFWKGNELVEKEFKWFTAGRWRVLALAIGNMKNREARPLLEEALQESFYLPLPYPYDEYDADGVKSLVMRSRSITAEALGMLADPASVPALLKVYLSPDDPPDGTGVALSKCVNRDSLSVLKTSLDEVKNDNRLEHRRNYLKGLIEKVETGKD